MQHVVEGNIEGCYRFPGICTQFIFVCEQFICFMFNELLLVENDLALMKRFNRIIVDLLYLTTLFFCLELVSFLRSICTLTT